VRSNFALAMGLYLPLSCLCSLTARPMPAAVQASQEGRQLGARPNADYRDLQVHRTATVTWLCGADRLIFQTGTGQELDLPYRPAAGSHP